MRDNDTSSYNKTQKLLRKARKIQQLYNPPPANSGVEEEFRLAQLSVHLKVRNDSTPNYQILKSATAEVIQRLSYDFEAPQNSGMRLAASSEEELPSLENVSEGQDLHPDDTDKHFSPSF